MKIVRLMCLALLLLLTSCGVLAQRPPQQAVKLAVTQQLTDIQHSIADGLRISNDKDAIEPNFKINKVSIRSREKLSDSNALLRRYSAQNIAELYRVKGTFDATMVDASAQKISQEGLFDVYLGTDAAPDAAPDTRTPEEIETWFLIQP